MHLINRAFSTQLFLKAGLHQIEYAPLGLKFRLEAPIEKVGLYAPVKRYLEALGFTVKGEVCGSDLVALHGEEPPIVVIGELKLAFSLELVLQGVDRTAACDEVWLAVRVARRGGPSPARPTLSAPPSRPTVTPNDARRRVSTNTGHIVPVLNFARPFFGGV